MSVNLLDLNKDWQQKRPELILKNNSILFKGYQNYEIKNGIFPKDKKLKKKTVLIKPELKNLKVDSVLDLGCAGLYFGLLAYYELNSPSLTGVEIDKEYIEKLNELSKYLKFDFNIIESRLDLFSPSKQYDLVFALAIIHWIYSCSSYFGSLDNVIKFLANLTNKYIFIEFVDENDPVTKKLNHIKYNDAEPDYSKENFIKYLDKYFSIHKFLGKSKSTREIYLCQK
jgi:SAM-dependent methyltransferase